ncbi:zinc finger protein 862-like [Lingula anatina]|uniref:Zinc finger protein 862-like n=1 Tax=Lingula anatina TaxID=7574 RepID=A0A2R2MP35_LINAN|nr:zinc finger protein 862-like [Lingula anatina]|eukprot:XP_023931989.1 zinc finger protein 862-like [Lingula anatina]
MVAAIAATVEEDLLQKMKSSPFLTILADESTDVTVTKKLVICVRLLDDNFFPSTHFVADINVTDGKGATVAVAIKDYLKSKEIPLSKIYGFGSDGAASMTSMGNGVAGRLLAENPAMVHIHCIAHRLALCTSQAANAIDYMKDYQSTITSIFYYFKASSVRVNRITAIQELLDEPILKCNEVHEVRWLPYYKAIETIYRTYGSLVSYMSEMGASDAKAKGFAKKLSQFSFVFVTHMLLSILSIVTELCLLFQKKDLDPALVDVNVKHALRELQKHRDHDTSSEGLTGKPGSYIEEFLLKVGTGQRKFFRDHLLTCCANYEKQCKAIQCQFIDNLINNINARFPQDHLDMVTAFGYLSIRPLSFLSESERENWGEVPIQKLASHYGNIVEHHGSKSVPIIIEKQGMSEWSKLKELVFRMGYARDATYNLWSIIKTHHSEDFPNLLKLAAISLILPIHTSDCERTFSSQYYIKNHRRNRLSETRLQQCLLIMIEGKAIGDFDFKSALDILKKEKKRRIYNKQ